MWVGAVSVESGGVGGNSECGEVRGVGGNSECGE